jgi:hypothetical protein
VSIFAEESPEDKAFWATLEGAQVAAPADTDPAEEEAAEGTPADPPAPAEGEEGAEEEAPAADEEGQGDVEDDESGAEDGSAEPDDAPEPSPEEQRLAEIQARLELAERRINEKDEFINRQANELGELRGRQSQFEQQSSMSGWEEVLDENPAQAAELALNAGDQRRYMIAREAWEEISPGAPRNFEQNITLARELDQLKSQLQSTTAPLQARAEIEQVASAYAQVKETYPDYDDHEDAMAQIMNTRPLMKESLQSVLRNGSVEEQRAALEDLYTLATGRRRDTLKDAERAAAATLAATTSAAKKEAAVVTGGGSPEEVGQSIADKIADEWEEIEAPRRDGWLQP